MTYRSYSTRLTCFATFSGPCESWWSQRRVLPTLFDPNSRRRLPPQGGILCPSSLAALLRPSPPRSLHHHLGGLALPLKYWSPVLNLAGSSVPSPPDCQRGQPGLRVALLPSSLRMQTSFSLLPTTFSNPSAPVDKLACAYWWGSRVSRSAMHTSSKGDDSSAVPESSRRF